MKNFLFLLFSLCTFVSSSFAQGTTDFGKVEPFEQDGKWGLKINGEVCFLPSFDAIRPDGNYFIFTENGKEGIMSDRSILCPAIYDKILSINGIHNIVIYETEAGRGVQQFKAPKFVDLSNNIVDGSKYVMNIYPGQYKNFILSTEAKAGSSLFYSVCETHDGAFKIIDVYGNDMTPYYDLKKLKGNIKDMLAGKIPLSDLKVQTYVSDIEKDFKKTYKKHPEFYYFNHPYLRKIVDESKLDEKNKIATISAGPYDGFISEDGFVSIPLRYSDAQEVLKRDPANLYALNHLISADYSKDSPDMPDTFLMDSNQRFDAFQKYYNEEYVFYSSYIPVWEKMLALAKSRNEQNFVDLFAHKINYCRDKAAEAHREVEKYGKVASITGSLNTLAQGLMDTASMLNTSPTSASADTGYRVSSTVSGSSVAPAASDRSTLSEQTAYNRDKHTYERYDSQLAAHFAGNQTMSASSVRDAQNSMRSIRAKWESRGKSFPRSANEDR